MRMTKELTIKDFEEIKTLFQSIFTVEPWNDDWSNEEQLCCYIKDLMGNPNSLAYGLYEEDKLVGLSLGSIRHWWTGTEYVIDEFCVATSIQGQGRGTEFLASTEASIKEKGIVHIFLQTERSVKAYQFYIKQGFQELPDHVSFWKEI